MTDPHSEFIPPFCPRPKCKFHLDPAGWRFKKDGYHYRQCDRRYEQRYRCSHCQRSFCTQTFSTTYWLKRPDVLEPIQRSLLSCSGYRQIARALDISPSTVALQAARAGRHALLFDEVMRPRTAVTEPLVVDGFESFEFSQYWPTHLNTVVGAESHFIYATTASELRRKGRMTEKQSRRREELEAELGRPDPKAIEKGVAEALALAVPPSKTPQVLRSDEHKAYPRSIARLPDRRFSHETTSSKQARTPSNPLFPVNLLHLVMRHSGANHKRETIAFSKRNQSMIWRDALHRTWRNYMKHLSERKKDASPAMRLGLTTRLLSWPQVLAKRLFVSQMDLAQPLATYYWGDVPTRQIPNGRSHRLKYAF